MLRPPAHCSAQLHGQAERNVNNIAAIKDVTDVSGTKEEIPKVKRSTENLPMTRSKNVEADGRISGALSDSAGLSM